MKKVVVILLLVLACSIIIEQYLYYQSNKLVYTEINIPGNSSHQHSEEGFDNQEFIVETDQYLNLCNQLSLEKIIYPLNFHPQKSNNYIWQPPEMI